MIPVTINNKPHQLPSSWKEVSVSMFLSLRLADTFSKVIAVLATIPLKEIKESTELDLDERLYPLIQWYTDAPDWNSLTPPKQITVMDKVIEIPKDLGYSTFEQVENLKTLFYEEYQKQQADNFNFTELIIPAFAMWLQPEYDQAPYNEYKSEEFQKIVGNLPIVEVFPIVSFFFKKYLESLILKKEHSRPGLRMKTIMYLKKRILKTWTSLEALEQSSISQKVTREALKKSYKRSTMSYFRTEPTK